LGRVLLCYLQFDYAATPQFSHAETAVLDWKIGAFAAQLTVTTQAPIDPKFAQAHQKAPRVEVVLEAVTYKTVIGYVLLAWRLFLPGFAWPGRICIRWS